MSTQLLSPISQLFSNLGGTAMDGPTSKSEWSPVITPTAFAAHFQWPPVNPQQPSHSAPPVTQQPAQWQIDYNTFNTFNSDSQFTYNAPAQPSELLSVPQLQIPVPRRAPAVLFPAQQTPLPPFVEERPTLQPPVVQLQSVSPPVNAISPAELSVGSSDESDQDEYTPQSEQLSRRASSASVDSFAGPQRSGSVSSRTSSRRSSKSGAEKRFKCDRPGCDRVFARRYNLASHIASTHEQRKPYQCTACPKSFSRRHDLGRHLAAVHESSAEDIAAAKAQQPSPTQAAAVAHNALAQPQQMTPQPGPSTAAFVPASVDDSAGMIGVGLDGRQLDPYDAYGQATPFFFG